MSNRPIARWLSAWSATVEESLRLVVLNYGETDFRRFLEDRRAFDSNYKSRWQELLEKCHSSSDAPIEIAEFTDLEEYVGRKIGTQVLRDNLYRCRLARNDAVHHYVSSMAAIRAVTQVVHWLAAQGLV